MEDFLLVARNSNPSVSTVRRAVNNAGFATGVFAVDPIQPFVYFCGSSGVTSSKPFNPERSGQRKQVARGGCFQFAGRMSGIGRGLTPSASTSALPRELMAVSCSNAT